MSGNFLSCSKGVKDPLEILGVRCDYPRDASAEMGLISPGGSNLLDFLELRQVLSTFDGDFRSTPRSMSALERNAQVPAPTLHKVLGPASTGKEALEAPELLAWGLAFPEATRAGP